MKRTIILSAFIAISLSTGVTAAQTSDLRLTFSEATDPNGKATGYVVFTGLEDPDVEVFEAVVPAANEADCFANTDFSNARRVGPDSASLSYDPATNSHTLRWSRMKERRDTCRVLIVGRTRLLVGSDLAVWQTNFGSGSLSENEMSTNGISDLGRSDGSVRPIQYSIALNPVGSQNALAVKYPGQERELIEARFPESPGRNFVIFEAMLPASTEAECLATTDFSTAVPADPVRATIFYNPASGLWYLKNSNSTGLQPPCRAVLADGGRVDAADYVVWRSQLGSTATQPRTTYAFGPVMANQ
ncbi:MAG TPA: hypothetical protein VFZ23_08540 [Pyrinomonadaceae bacterium]